MEKKRGKSEGKQTSETSRRSKSEGRSSPALDDVELLLGERPRRARVAKKPRFESLHTWRPQTRRVFRLTTRESTLTF